MMCRLVNSEASSGFGVYGTCNLCSIPVGDSCFPVFLFAVSLITVSKVGGLAGRREEERGGGAVKGCVGGERERGMDEYWRENNLITRCVDSRTYYSFLCEREFLRNFITLMCVV